MTTVSPKRLVLCLDGTWNNPYQKRARDDGSEVLKPTNPLKMARAVCPWDEATQVSQITYYDTGVGALGQYPGVSNRIVGYVDRTLGGARHLFVDQRPRRVADENLSGRAEGL